MSKKTIRKCTRPARRMLTDFVELAIEKHSNILDNDAKKYADDKRAELIYHGANPKSVDDYDNFIKQVVAGVFPREGDVFDKRVKKHGEIIILELLHRLVDEATIEGADVIILENYAPDDGYDE